MIIPFEMDFKSMLRELGSMSMGYGSKPLLIIALYVAIYVRDVVTTCPYKRLDNIFTDLRARKRAEVPLLTKMAYLVPMYLANSSSNWAQYFPRVS